MADRSDRKNEGEYSHRYVLEFRFSFLSHFRERNIDCAENVQIYHVTFKKFRKKNTLKSNYGAIWYNECDKSNRYFGSKDPAYFSKFVLMNVTF